MKRKSRLKKLSEGDPSIPMGIIFKDFDQKIVDKDQIEDITYGPSISREWEFELPRDNQEWALQSDFAKKK